MESSDQNNPGKGLWETIKEMYSEFIEGVQDVSCSMDFIHDYSDWQYLEEGICKRTKVCNKCQKHLEGKVKHTFGEAKILKEHSCTYYKTCTRCNHKEQARIEHTWGKWGPTQQKKKWTFHVGRLREVYRFLKKHTKQDIKQICGLMGIEYEDLPGERKSEKVQELLNVCIAQKRIPELLEVIPEAINGLKQSHRKRLSDILDDLELAEMQHDQTEFSWEFDPELSCLEDRICSRCGEIESKEKHIWGTSDYVNEDSCEKIRYCQCCGKSEVSAQKAHKWGELKYDADHLCSMSRTCIRCNEKLLEVKEAHDWEIHPCRISKRCTRCKKVERIPNMEESHDWMQEEDLWNPCTIHIRCRRCRKPQASRTLHRWGASRIDGCRVYKQCSKCGQKAPIGNRHSWGPWVPQIGKVPLKQRICNSCGKMEEKHAY